MQQIELQIPVLHITEESQILDRGIVESSMITIASGVRVEYAYIPVHDGSYTRDIHMASGVRFHGTGVIATGNNTTRITTHVE
jgi:hypothetical protein